jgi:hypothetical protein
MAEGSLIIRRLQVEALLPRDHPDQHRVGGRFADCARQQVAPALVHALSEWTSDEIIRIRRIAVAGSLDLALPDETLGAALARSIAREIARLSTANDENVVRFPDCAAYLAAFLTALIENRAWDRWWFRDFDGLRPLPKATALCTALLAQPADGQRALAQLPFGTRRRVIADLGDHGAERVGKGLARSGGGEANPAEAVRALLEILSREDALPADLSGASAVLDLYVMATTGMPALAGQTLFAAINAVVLLLDNIPAAAPHHAAALLRALRSGTATHTLAQTSERLRHALALLRPLPAPERRALAVLALRRRQAGSDLATSDEGSAAITFTRFGGLFLLLPRFVELGLDEATELWQQPPGCRADNLLYLLLLASCTGRARAAAVLADPLWRDLLGIPPALGAAEIADWLAALPRAASARLAGFGLGGMTPRDARHLTLPPSWCRSRRMRRHLAAVSHSLLRAFTQRLPGFAGSSAGFLWRNFLNVGARVEIDAASIRVFIARPALDVLLTITGLGRAEFTLADGRFVSIERVP